MFIVKNDPSLRRICLLGEKNREEVEYIEFISQDKLLLKMKTGYWTLMSTEGQILEMKNDLKQVLNSANWTYLSAEEQDFTKTRLNLISDEYIASILLDHRGKILRAVRLPINQSEKTSATGMTRSRTKLHSRTLISYTGSELYYVANDNGGDEELGYFGQKSNEDDNNLNSITCSMKADLYDITVY